MMKIFFLSFVLVLLSCGEAKTKPEQSENTANPIENKVHLRAVLDTIWRTEQEPMRLRDSIMRVDGAQSVAFQRQQEIAHRNHTINEKK